MSFDEIDDAYWEWQFNWEATEPSSRVPSEREVWRAACAWRRLRGAMEFLYRAEINCGLQSFWDGGWRVWIGDGTNGIASEARGFGEGKGGGSLDGAGRWLLTEAKRLYPDAFKPRCSKCGVVLADDYHYLICSECFRDGMENEVS